MIIRFKLDLALLRITTCSFITILLLATLACNTEEEMGVSPIITLLDNNGSLVGRRIINNIDDPLIFIVNIKKGTSDLKTMTLYENGELLSREATFGSNPRSFFGSEKEEFRQEVVVFSDQERDAKTYEYLLEVEDENGLTSQVEFTYITELGIISGTLFNQAGVAGTGCMDLSSGEGLACFQNKSNIKDQGIDIDARPGNNWRQQISGVNGTEIVAVKDIKFEDISTRFEINLVFEKGVILSGDDNSCNCSDPMSNELVSDPVQVGDIFAVKSETVIYLMQCTSVNVTTTNNSDNYVFDIKY